jgi:hypothetical protein
MDRADYRQSEEHAMNWAEPTRDRIDHIAQRVRKCDEDEVFNAHAISGKQAVYQGWAESDLCRCIDGDDGTPVAVCGVNKGMIWLLGTDGLFASSSHVRQFIRGGKPWVSGLVDEWGCLHNWVYGKNRQSMRWLRSLGFTIHPAEPVGPFSQLFCYFERRKGQ